MGSVLAAITTMTAQQNAPSAQSGGGVRSLRATIIACLCTDDGVCIMCRDCGHVFVPSIPLSDESQPIDNTVLSRALWYHICAVGRVPEHKRRK